MNQILSQSNALSGEELRKYMVDILLANPNIDVVDISGESNRWVNIGRGKLRWDGNKWLLLYDFSKLDEDDECLLPYIKEFYAFFKAIEFYSEYEDYLISRFLGDFDEDTKVRFAAIMISDLEGTSDTHVTGDSKISAKRKIIEAYKQLIDEYWGRCDTAEITLVTKGGCKEVVPEVLDAAE